MLPKTPFTILIHFMIEGGHCKMLIADRADGKFDFDISDVANYETAFKFILKLLFDFLSAKPSNQVQEKMPIAE